jgi:hypothetical protein
MPSWRGAQLKHRDNFTLLLLYKCENVYIRSASRNLNEVREFYG